MSSSDPIFGGIVIAIPSVTARNAMRADLVDALCAHCRGALIIEQIHHPNTPARADFPRAMARAVATERTWILQCEDDIALAPDFGPRVASALRHLERTGADCATFFTRSKHDLAALDRGETWRKLSPGRFSMSQCFAVRAELMHGFEPWAHRWYERHPQHTRAADLLLADWLKGRRATLLAHVPSLVQHRLGASTLPRHHGARQSESFRRAYGDID
jgi:hypothetical protein